MIKVVLAFVLVTMIVIPAEASTIEAPEVFDSGRQIMPQNTESFGEGVLEILQNAMNLLRPNLREAAESCCVVIFSAMLFSALPLISQRINAMASVAGTTVIATVPPAGCPTWPSDRSPAATRSSASGTTWGW